MKMFLNKKLAMLLVFALLIPLFWNQSTDIAYAATPSFVQKTVEIVGEGESYQLEIKDKVAKSTYKWSSSNTKIATVSKTGLITAVAPGTATITCKITYPTKKTKTLTSKVTVTIPASGIQITNAVEKNGAHRMLVGESMNFDAALTPAISSDKVFWTIERDDNGSIRLDSATEGIVTALKPGYAILRATAAKSATKEAADLSIVNEAVIIEVVGLTATVKSVDIASSNEIKIVFDSPVNQSTVIGQNNTLTNNVTVSLTKDIKGVWADDPGKLTAVLSADAKTLTITTQNNLRGEYSITFTNGIITTGGVALEEYFKKISYIDQTPPEYLTTTVDDTGLIATLHFTEAIDISNLNVINATLISTQGQTISALTKSILENEPNYVLSEDKKSLKINLSNVSYNELGKTFTVVMSGIKDLAGNTPTSFTITPILYTDTTKRPQARLQFAVRTGYNTITATFDRAIQFPGNGLIVNGSFMAGVVDSTDPKKVNYTMSDSDALKTGPVQVNFNSWSSFNVIETDTSASKGATWTVDFTYERTSPYFIEKYDVETGILTLTFNEEVNIVSSTGIFSAKFTTANDEIRPNSNIDYSVVAHTEGRNVVKLKLSGFSLLGNYTFTIWQGFVTDNFKNQSLSKTIIISNTGGDQLELPGPYAITQSADNLSQIRLEFLHKLDKASAENVNNYKIAGLTIKTAELIKNTNDGATVILTVPDGQIKAEVSRPVTITGVKGYNNGYAPITSFTKDAVLKDNEKPNYIPEPVFDQATRNRIRLNFSEAIQGTMTVKVIQSTTTGASYELPGTVSVSGNNAYIDLLTVPNNNTWLRIEIVTNGIKDLNGNTAIMPTTLMVYVSY